MALPIHTAEIFPTEAPPVSPLQLYQRQLLFNPGDRRALIQDFFSWFEYEWRQPVVRANIPLASDLLTQAPCLKEMLDEQKMYTRSELSFLSGHTLAKIKADLKAHHVGLAGRSAPRGRNKNRPGLYLGRDLIPVIEKWEWDQLCTVVDVCWLRFVQEPCCSCSHCQVEPNTASFYCLKNHSNPILLYRRSFFYLLQALRIHGDLASWWDREHEAVFACKQGAITEPSKLVLLYLLDRHLLELSFEEMVRLSFRGNAREHFSIDHLRPYRHRRPEEYATLLRAMEMIPYKKKMQYDLLAIIAMLVLLKYGFPGLTELARKLEPEEVQQVIREKRLLTPHVAYGVYLDLPLSDDLRVGHVVLDDIRRYFWQYSAGMLQATNQPRWSHGPHGWQPSHMYALERILTADIWDSGRSLLPPRPELQLARVNPYTFYLRTDQESGAFYSLPLMLREALQAFVNYRYQQQRIAIRTITTDLRGIFSFFSWAREHIDVGMYASWDRDRIRTIVGAFLSAKRSSVQETTLYNSVNKLAIFFETLAELGLPHPPGYAVLPTLLPTYPKALRAIPREEIFDRLFHDGVCQLDYDPFARLALTIQYFCGTRVTETCDLPLFCIIEDTDSQFAYLVIPKGKTKQERSFPLAPLGMGPLLDYMDQVVRLQIHLDGKLRNFSRTNLRYVETEPEKAYHWDYLFDRQYSSSGRVWRQSVLSPSRVRYALEEAILLAAKHNSTGFFQQETYSPICRLHRDPGQLCWFLALQDGVTICPICAGALPGRRGHRCHHRLTQAFTCDGVAQNGAYFCPKCDAPLAEMVSITSHTFRHNSVTRAHRHGVPLAENMLLHGHQTVPMHLRYLHLLPEDQQAAVHRIFSEKLLREMRVEANHAPGQVIEEGVAHTATVEQLIGLTLRRELRRRTAGLWGGFWTGALAEEGMMSPLRQKAEIILTEETYHHAVAQYRYEALGLAVSEVALERGTKGKYKATFAPFLERREIERVVSSYMRYVQQGYLNTARGVRLIEADIKAQRLFLDELAEMLRPWWQHLGTIDDLVNAFFSGEDLFQKTGAADGIEQE